MDRDVVHKVGHQKMKCEKRRGQEKIVQWMNINAPNGSNDEHQKKEKEQRHGSKQADASCQRSGLKFFRHDHADLIAGEQVFVIPLQLPAFGRLMLFAGRERVVREINVFEIGGHRELEIFYVRNLLAEVVTPISHSLRRITYLEDGGLAGTQTASRPGRVAFILELNWRPI